PPEYNMDIQARIPPALAAIHNFILYHDSLEWDDILEMATEDPNPGTRANDDEEDFGDLAQGPTSDAEKLRSEARRNVIAQEMWVSYQALLQERGGEFPDE
ncbi:hypothetical protein DFH09DRAFT_921635, partial [Mycena vulgaris]